MLRGCTTVSLGFVDSTSCYICCLFPCREYTRAKLQRSEVYIESTLPACCVADEIVLKNYQSCFFLLFLDYPNHAQVINSAFEGVGTVQMLGRAVSAVLLVARDYQSSSLCHVCVRGGIDYIQAF